MTEPAVLMLEDGCVFRGCGIGARGCSSGEVVFNTAMTGYQEILTDPSYARQIVTLTCAHVGNTGVNALDAESDRPQAAGLVIREDSPRVSCWRSERSLPDYLKQHDVVCIAGVDTRKLTRKLRHKGSMRGVIASGARVVESDLRDRLDAFGGLRGMDLAIQTGTRDPYLWHGGSWDEARNAHAQPSGDAVRFQVVAVDFGAKRNILRLLADRGCEVSVVPPSTTAADILAARPDGVFLSNGPGDPDACNYAISAVRSLLEARIPLFGICLGHQILALAAGASTVKMKIGHHGANHPVRDEASGRVFITSQNHGFMVEAESLPKCLSVTHRSLFDGSIQGLRHRDTPAFGFQGHPEASPGPHDVAGLFDVFTSLMQQQPMGS